MLVSTVFNFVEDDLIAIFILGDIVSVVTGLNFCA